MRYVGMTAEEIFEAAENDEQVVWSVPYAEKIVRQHTCDFKEYLATVPLGEPIKAAHLLDWLGY